MNVALRQWLNRIFTMAAILAVAMIVTALVAILLPMMWRGAGAVVFGGTVEFRRMQLEQFNRGDRAALAAQVEATNQVRARAYEILDRFVSGIDTTALQTRVRQIHREFTLQMNNRDLPPQTLASSRETSKQVRDQLLAALETTDKAVALAALDSVDAHATDGTLKDTAASNYFDVARQYRQILIRMDPAYRGEYAVALGEVQEAVKRLFGPRPGDRLPAVVMDQYGATRWDQAGQQLDRLLWAEKWESPGDGQPVRKVRISRADQFAGTEMAELFPYVYKNLRAMLLPERTFYWQFFTDDNISGHYFGGVGPEIIGTLLVTLLAIAFALPTGVVAAAYLVECASDNLLTRVLRTCVNTLAGVPSIVFGLFGLAFFVIYLLPRLGLPEGSSILAGALTLALLVLPVVIRASEEAIRTVPRAYKEASLALGASRFRCFVTVTLPAAMPGILTGLILSMSRAAGETAPILFTAGVAMGPIPTSLAQPTRTLAYGSYDMAVGDKMAALAPHNQYGIVMTLVGLVLVLNLVAIVVRARVSRRLRGQ
ncbi:MAG: phosphate ABC transporter permease PstA [Phycisphaerae bacterium]|jgi:phosphate transport system permease protein